jgi:hypothetical protein
VLVLDVDGHGRWPQVLRVAEALQQEQVGVWAVPLALPALVVVEGVVVALLLDQVEVLHALEQAPSVILL